MSEARIDSIANESNTGGPVLSGITEFSGQQYFIPPTGTTAERPSDCPPGSIRFNTDSAHLEYWNGLVWLEFEASSVELGDQNNTNSTGGTGTRAIFGGGYNAGNKDHMDYVTIDTLGNAQDFGDLGVTALGPSGYAGRVFGFFSGYVTGSNIYKNTIASTGSSVDSTYDLSVARGYCMGLSNSTRGIVSGGITPSTSSVIDYHSIPIGGNAVDFGDLILACSVMGTGASSVRGIIAGGSDGPTNFYNTIGYITIPSTGNAQDFGDLSTGRSQFGCSFSSATRGVFGGGITGAAPTTPVNTIDFITIASTGNAQDFGDMSRTNTRHAASACSSTRGVFAGGDPHASPYPKSNEIDFLTIPTTGNSLDFGDLANQARNHFSGCSNGHGGLS